MPEASKIGSPGFQPGLLVRQHQPPVRRTGSDAGWSVPAQYRVYGQGPKKIKAQWVIL